MAEAQYSVELEKLLCELNDTSAGIFQDYKELTERAQALRVSERQIFYKMLEEREWNDRKKFR